VRLLVALLLLALLVLAGGAQASRLPTTAERIAISTAVERFAERPGPPRAGAEVKRVRVSTVDGRYAIAKLRTGEGPVLSTAILRRAGPAWRVVTYGTAGFAFRGVPRPVLDDLLGAELCGCARTVTR
jgi:hypothetical protein